MLYYYLWLPYNSKYYYLLSGIDRVVKKTERGVWRARSGSHNPKISREIFESPRSQYPDGRKEVEKENVFHQTHVKERTELLRLTSS